MAVSVLRDTLVLLALAACVLGATLFPSRTLDEDHFSDKELYSERIYGGEDAVPGEAPFIVSLQLLLGERLYHNCGGSIITTTAVLTAAHCTSDLLVVAVAGAYNISSNSSTEQYVPVIEQIPYPEYNDTGSLVGPYDIAVFRLEYALTLDSYVQVIGLPSAESIPEGGSEATLWGWGYTETGRPTEILQTVTVTIYDYGTCLEYLQYMNVTSFVLTEAILCTGPFDEGISMCAGDDGGPLEQDGVLVGIVSFSPTSCSTQGGAAVYTRVSAYMDFITENI
ncbi:chymotrypsin-like elastase family member 1 [Schistocerca gregaria]|uniref:chymotrypsin-like elastase family member 1 n=1 Tax=Schistocerca gregaria TaxID=7010 RepID=UPI00211DAE00|nr:chymotrypsin-like elastase family member 1 [Schistocerca gregaria]